MLNAYTFGSRFVLLYNRQNNFVLLVINAMAIVILIKTSIRKILLWNIAFCFFVLIVVDSTEEFE
jgi:hypothetical protein